MGSDFWIVLICGVSIFCGVSIGITFSVMFADSEPDNGALPEVSDELELLYQAVQRFEQSHPYNATINYTCWPRAMDFVKMVRLMGYEAVVRYGCDGKAELNTTGCHAWVEVSGIEVLGSRDEYPVMYSDNELFEKLGELYIAK